MKKKPKYLRNSTRKKGSRRIPVFCGIAAVLFMLILAILSMLPKDAQSPKLQNAEATAASDAERTENTALEENTIPEEITVPTETTAPVETEPVMLADMAELYEENPEVIGWIWIDDTKLNYPVMHTPEEPEKYLHLSFEKTYSVGGVPFLDADCSLDPESDNLIIYGHNMTNGTQFRTLMSYDQKTYWEAHPNIYFSTLYEERTYEIIACFYDRVYYKYEDVFKFYQFVDAEDEESFNEAITYYKENALYDTGVTASYGDSLLTLVTCAYHVDNGRFVVVAREKNV